LARNIMAAVSVLNYPMGIIQQEARFMASMASSISTPSSSRRSLLPLSVRAWFVVTAIGQAIFLFYITGYYAPPVARGTLADWSKYRDLIDGHVASDTTGNMMFGIHVALAAILTLGGVLQLWPALRQRVPRLHRWNGRLFVGSALLAALGGLWLVWVRGSRLSTASDLSITLNAVLVLGFVTLAWRAARARNFSAHQDWAMRAFFVVSGVWFLRIGIMGFGLVATGVFGAPKDIVMAFFPYWSFGSYLVPLGVYELYRRARASSKPTARTAMAAGLMTLTLVMAGGIFGATLTMWLPPLRASGLFG
jgi:Predicted membrane protein (DUF2306)